MRTCNVCKETLPAGAFYAGVQSRCKDCHKSRMKEIRLTSPRVQQYDRERAKTPERKRRARLITIKWRDKNPDAYRAQTAVGNAVRDGRLKKLPCVMCGATKNVHAHHKDYAKPLEVKWLCAKCHHRIHSNFPELGGHRVTP